MKNNYNAQLVYVEKEVGEKKYTNFYLRLADGLLSVSVKINDFGDTSIYGKLKHYCDKTNNE